MRILSGIQPSGDIHIGNYFGAIKQIIKSQNDGELYAFIASYHALTSLKDKNLLQNNIIQVAINFLSLGLDPQKTTFWVQSDVPQVLELYWILSNYTPMGLLQRAHSYKDKVAKEIPANHGLFSYPVLMAADILLYDSQIVPVGKDQIQHLEITRDIANIFNNTFGDIFTMPQVKVDDDLQSVLGTDGAKMSKSYKNTIDLFASPKKLKKQVMSITTDSTPLKEPKEYKNCNIYRLCELFMNDDELTELQQRYKNGKEGYGHFKLSLLKQIEKYFAPYEEKRQYYLNHIDEVKDILDFGAKKAQKKAQAKIDILRDIVGLS